MESYIELTIQANEKKFTDVEKIIAQYFLDGNKELGIQELAKASAFLTLLLHDFVKKLA